MIQTPEVNCYGSLEYRYKINGGNNQSTSNNIGKFNRGGSQSFEFSVLAVNKEDLTSAFATKTGTSPPLGK